MQSRTSRLRYTVDTTEASMGPILMVYVRNYLEKVTASNATHYHENIQQVRVLQSRNGNHIKTMRTHGQSREHIIRVQSAKISVQKEKFVSRMPDWTPRGGVLLLQQ
jgi:hypothetical protein